MPTKTYGNRGKPQDESNESSLQRSRPPDRPGRELNPIHTKKPSAIPTNKTAGGEGTHIGEVPLQGNGNKAHYIHHSPQTTPPRAHTAKDITVDHQRPSP
ncbi:hypothetical protein SUGI_0551760 [Cryptomeria japonica]|nr:hypothetical protein SUGI_0551760 [Cryptomeria japonica]